MYKEDRTSIVLIADHLPKLLKKQK